jgi:hypothetical protein
MAQNYNGRNKKPASLLAREYFVSGNWKCPSSATGGHWWNCNVKPNVCKFCGKIKAGSEL